MHCYIVKATVSSFLHCVSNFAGELGGYADGHTSGHGAVQDSATGHGETAAEEGELTESAHQCSRGALSGIQCKLCSKIAL